ncbi:SLC13 family permease [Pseudoroseomonas rhizosphaerae]|uniref:SLC13 family permease n=1 Tax=Teichococcus rhizosphaerae TaxID=1335062 RepID=A0A2C7A8J9_9PROT|nr:SLC13 family permease [Pseudoroseomonas rhizosphaerae]PHK93953.1 SLC13 family permease [Pseudoroseomonas rhizosphaerae]
MTLDQGLAFGILGVTVGLFLWGRIAYELVALLALLAGVLVGIIPIDRAFAGFADDVVVIVAAALLVSAAVARSGAIETLMRPVLPYLGSTATQVPALAGAVLVTSIFTKNIGALAIFMPVALQLARRTGTSPSALLMPMAFASLIGGLITLTGTSPNIIVARVRAEVTGEPFGMFDYTPVGLGIALAGMAFLAFGWRLLPRGRRGTAEAAPAVEDYTTEVQLPAGSPLAGRGVAELLAMEPGRIGVAVIIRERFRRFVPTPEGRLRAGDTLLLEGDPEDLERVIARAGLRLAAAEDKDEGGASVAEGVVTAESPLAGETAERARLQERFGVGLLAVSRSGQRIARRLGGLRLRAGDVLILRGAAPAIAGAFSALRVLPLTERSIALGRSRRSWVPLLVLLSAMLLVALHVVPVSIAFFGAAVLLLALRSLSHGEAYGAVEWPVLILLGALIPVSEAVRTTGGTDLIAAWLEGAARHLPPLGALGLIMAIAMAVTPFLNNAATVLMMGPIAASLAQRLGLSPDAFLMAVAVGAACDFLTPIGHQCNTLVMGPGGYRFGDYARLGAPLTLIVLGVGVPLIALVWGLSPG